MTETKTIQEQQQEQYWDDVAEVIGSVKLDYPGQVEQDAFFSFMALPDRPLRILEIGAGAGRLTMPLLLAGHNVVATELSVRSLEILRQWAEKNGVSDRLTTVHTNFEEPLWTNEFDLVLFVNVIHHIDRNKRLVIMKNVYQALRLGGPLVIIEPNPLNVFYYVLYFARWLKNSQKKNRWATEKGMVRSTRWHIESLLKQAGFTSVQRQPYAWFPSKAGNIYRGFLALNHWFNRLPVVREAAAFIWYRAVK